MNIDPNVFVRALELTADPSTGAYSCNSIAKALGADYFGDLNKRFPEVAIYSELFAPMQGVTDGSWLVICPHIEYDDRQAWRETALCFCVAMAEAGDL